MSEIRALSKLIFLSGMRSNSILFLLLFSVLLELSGVFFIDFFGRDIGRLVVDFIFTIMWISGMLFILFYAIQSFSWDDNNRMIDTILSRPISRVKYVLGMTLGVSSLLLFFETLVFIGAIIEIEWIRHTVELNYFPVFNYYNFILSWVGIQLSLMVILSVSMLSTSVMRGGFPVLIMTLSYYLIGSGLPVIRGISESSSHSDEGLIKIIQFIFPDLSLLDWKSSITESAYIFNYEILHHIIFILFYVFIILYLTCMIYKRKDIL